jgi:Domain of unknown function (DUF4386)
MTCSPGGGQARAARLAGALRVITNRAAAAAVGIRSTVAGDGDVAAVSRNILAGEVFYRLSIALDLAMVAGVVALVWALYRLLRPVDQDLALLATCFRMVEVVVLAVMAVAMMLSLRVLSRPDYLSMVEAGQLESAARLLRSAHGLGFTVAFVFLGVGSAVFAWLFWQGRYVPRWVAGWGIAASSLFVLCALAMIVWPSAAPTLQIVAFAPMGLYEVGLGTWLWIRGAELRTASQDSKRQLI